MVRRFDEVLTVKASKQSLVDEMIKQDLKLNNKLQDIHLIIK